MLHLDATHPDHLEMLLTHEVYGVQGADHESALPVSPLRYVAMRVFDFAYADMREHGASIGLASDRTHRAMLDEIDSAIGALQDWHDGPWCDCIS